VGKGAGYVPPSGPVQELIAEIWEQVLGLDQVGATDNFFDLGGHSLLATQVISRVREVLGAEIPLAALFDHPTVAELSVDVRQLLGGHDDDGRNYTEVEI
jgi:acyl carrier protein